MLKRTPTAWRGIGECLRGACRVALSSKRGLFQPSTGPDVPHREGSEVGLPRWPAGWHDHLQYHFFFEGLFVQARVFMTPSLEEHSVWIYDHSVGKVQTLLNSSKQLRQGEEPFLDLTGPQFHVSDGPGGGKLKLLGEGGEEELAIQFWNKTVVSWLPAGQDANAVIHRPDLELSLVYKGKNLRGRGYSKRYFGEYGPHWGYRFIQSSWLGGKHFLWTADATFRLGGGEAKYNYFKLLDGQSGNLLQAESRDTYQQDSAAYAQIGGEQFVATVTPLGEWMHDYKAGETNSRMQLRYCEIKLTQGSGHPTLTGYALNERCFGVL